MRQLVATARNPVPFGADVGEVPGRGPVLRYASWHAVTDEPSGTVCIFPGRAEFIEKYLETVADLRRRGYAVSILDWRGQGGSERLVDHPRKGHVGNFDEYLEDADRWLSEVVLGRLPGPYIGLGHSMGGHILLRHAAAGADATPFERLVLCAPMVGIHRKRLGVSEPLAYTYASAMSLAGLGSGYVPGGGPAALEAMPFEDNPLSLDRERFDRMQEVSRIAPELLVGDPTLGWLAAALASMRTLARSRQVRAIRTPALFFIAGQDLIVSSQAIIDLVDRLKVASCVTFETARHEILQERDTLRSRFWAAFDAFLDVSAAAA